MMRRSAGQWWEGADALYFPVNFAPLGASFAAPLLQRSIQL
jgi:hypothetical protein